MPRHPRPGPHALGRLDRPLRTGRGLLPRAIGSVAALAVAVGALGGGTPAAAAPSADAPTGAGPIVTTAAPSNASARVTTALPQAEDFTEGMRVESSTTYRVDLTASVVHVEHVANIINQVPDRVTASYIEQYYFDTYSVPVPAGAANVTASRDGAGALGVTVEPGDGEFLPIAVVDLRPNLYYGDQYTIRLTYDLPAQPLRTGTIVQVNQAFATFPVFNVADPGLATVSVVLPTALQVEVVGSAMEKSEADGTTTYTAAAIEDPANWWSTIIVRDDSQLVEEIVQFGDTLVTVQAWPGDAEWLTFTSDLVERGLPALKDAIGRPWGEDGQLTIVETTAPYVYGYGGWYEKSRSLIEVGDALDAHVTLHEMAHAWFNQELFSGRWLSEALADEFAALTMAELGMERPVPTEVSPDAAGAVALNDWTTPDLDAPETEAQEQYGYEASWWVAHLLMEEIGADAMSQVVQAAGEHANPYPAETDRDPVTWVADWRTTLDLLEGVGGSTIAEQVFRDFVVSDEDLAALDERAAAREAYAALVESADGWAPPADIRDDMAAWAFADATALIPAIEDLLEQRDAIAADLQTIDMDVPEALREDFEGNPNVDGLADVMDDAEAAVAALVTAVTAEEEANPLARVGLLLADAEGSIAAAGAELEEGDYEDATALATQAASDVEGATLKGLLLVGGALLVLAFVVVGVWLLRRRARRRAAAPPALPAAPLPAVLPAGVPVPVGAAAPFGPAGPAFGPPPPVTNAPPAPVTSAPPPPPPVTGAPPAPVTSAPPPPPPPPPA